MRTASLRSLEPHDSQASYRRVGQEKDKSLDKTKQSEKSASCRVEKQASRNKAAGDFARKAKVYTSMLPLPCTTQDGGWHVSWAVVCQWEGVAHQWLRHVSGGSMSERVAHPWGGFDFCPFLVYGQQGGSIYWGAKQRSSCL